MDEKMKNKKKNVILSTHIRIRIFVRERVVLQLVPLSDIFYFQYFFLAFV